MIIVQTFKKTNIERVGEAQFKVKLIFGASVRHHPPKTLGRIDSIIVHVNSECYSLNGFEQNVHFWRVKLDILISRHSKVVTERPRKT